MTTKTCGLGRGQWTAGSGRWTVDSGQWAVGNGQWTWVVDGGQETDSGQWTRTGTSSLDIYDTIIVPLKSKCDGVTLPLRKYLLFMVTSNDFHI